MSIEIGVLIAVGSFIISISSFAINTKKSNKTDGFEIGSFMGEMRTELANIKSLIGELKQDNKEVDDKINKSIIEHEKRYHSKN